MKNKTIKYLINKLFYLKKNIYYMYQIKKSYYRVRNLLLLAIQF